MANSSSMRDLLLFAGCCLLAAAFWISSHRHASEHEAALQAELYRLGAPQTMQDSPERSMLLGSFAEGLRQDGSPETFDRLASLFLVSAGLDGRKVQSSAHNASIMARVAGKTIELFDPKGGPLAAKLWLLGDGLAPFSKPLFEATAGATLVADGPWLLYRDSRRSAVFRRNDEDLLQAYISSLGEITVDGDTILVEGKKGWIWRDGHLEAVPAG